MLVAPSRLLLSLTILLGSASCVYPRRTTWLTPAPGDLRGVEMPSDLWQLRIASAEVPVTQRSGLAWDDDDGKPDVFLRLYRGGRLIWESPVQEDTIAPVWDIVLPENVLLPNDEEIRIEMWDRDDGVVQDPIGLYTRFGLPPNALPDADARIVFEGGATLGFKIERPIAHLGVGIRDYEARGSEFIVRDVEPFSPAGRAGVALGDRIIAIGGRNVSDLSDAQAASALSQAASRRESLTLRSDNNEERTAELDGGFVWLSM